MDLGTEHDRWGSNSYRSLNGHLRYPTDIDRTLNKVTVDKVSQYRIDYNNRPSHDISFMSAIFSTSGCLHCVFECLLFLQTHRETDRFLASSGVHLVQKHFHSRHTVFSSQFKCKVDHIFVKAVALRIMLYIDGSPIGSRSHTHTSHTQTLSY